MTVVSNAGPLIALVRPLLDRMRANGYWMSDRIVAETLRQAGE